MTVKCKQNKGKRANIDDSQLNEDRNFMSGSVEKRVIEKQCKSIYIPIVSLISLTASLNHQTLLGSLKSHQSIKVKETTYVFCWASYFVSVTKLLFFTLSNFFSSSDYNGWQFIACFCFGFSFLSKYLKIQKTVSMDRWWLKPKWAASHFVEIKNSTLPSDFVWGIIEQWEWLFW